MSALSTFQSSKEFLPKHLLLVHRSIGNEVKGQVISFKDQKSSNLSTIKFKKPDDYVSLVRFNLHKNYYLLESEIYKDLEYTDERLENHINDNFSTGDNIIDCFLREIKKDLTKQ